MERKQKREWLSRPRIILAWAVMLGITLNFVACSHAVETPSPSPSPASPTGTPKEVFLPTSTKTATVTVAPTVVPTETPIPTATRKARIPIRNVLIEGSSTVRNINTDVLGGKELNCDVIPPYCLTARGKGDLRVSQVRDMVQKTVDLDNYQALVLYDPQNSMTFDRLTGAQTYDEHRKTVDWVNNNHPDVLVVSGTALDTTMEDEHGRVQRERDDYNGRLIGGNGLGEIVFDPRNVLRRNSEPDPVCFPNGEQLHINDVCQKRALDVLKKTLDWWQNLGLTLPIKQNLPLGP